MEILAGKESEKILWDGGEPGKGTGWCEPDREAGGIPRHCRYLGQRQIHIAPYDGRAGYAHIGAGICGGKDISALSRDELTIFRRRKIGFVFPKL